MAEESERRSVGVLASKRDATRYRILVEIAARQPAVSQQEIADAIGVTAQAVSDYLGDLVERGDVRKHGRGRYEVTKEGVDWLISQTDDLREFLGHVTDNVIEEVEVDAAIAAEPVEAGETVTRSMRDGVMHVTPGAEGPATAVAVTDADAGDDVAVTEFEGFLEFDPGTVKILPVAPVQEGGGRAVDTEQLRERADDADLLAAAGTEALAAVRGAGDEPDVRFGTVAAVEEAATRGLDVLLVTTEAELSAHTATLGEAGVAYDVLDVGAD